MANTPKPDKDRRTEFITLRLSPRELRTLEKLCSMHKGSHSDVIRKALSMLYAMGRVVIPKVED